MKKPKQPIARSFSMLIVAYYLSRCGQRVEGKKSTPPSILGVKTWQEAYELFFDAMGDGRTPGQFHNSIRNARDTFDILLKTVELDGSMRKGNSQT